VVHIWHTFVCQAVDTFYVEQLTFSKKCRAVEIRAVEIRAVEIRAVEIRADDFLAVNPLSF
jgi:hypothetical protein